MIEGALIALAGVLVGRFLPGRRTKAPEAPRRAICGCRHTVGFHENKTGNCQHVDNWGERCRCQHYDGPIPIETYLSPPLLPPD